MDQFKIQWSRQRQCWMLYCNRPGYGYIVVNTWED